MATELYANNFQTTLGAAISSTTATSITTSAAAPTALQAAASQFRIIVDGEILIVTGGASTTTWTVIRGAEGTSAATHANGAAVTHVLTAGSLAALIQQSAPTVYVASAYAPVAQQAMANYVCDGVDDHVEINAAISYLKGLAPSQGVAGGKVQLLGPRFNTSQQIVLKSYVELWGQGRFYTQIRSQSTWGGSANDGLIAVDNTGGTTATEYVGLYHLCVDGNKSGQTATVTRGLNFQCDATTGWTYNDSMWVLDYLRIIDTLGDAIWLAGSNVRACRLSNLRIERPDASGLRTTCADSHFHTIDVGSAGTSGFYINGATNHRFTNCKAYFCGRLQTSPTTRSGTSVTGAGFRIEGTRNTFSACETQDNRGHGFAIGSNHNTLAGCQADSNSYDAGAVATQRGNADGFYIENDVHFVRIDGWSIDKNETNRGVNQNSGVFISTSTPLSSDLLIAVETDNNVSGPLGVGMTNPARSQVRVGGARFQAIGSVTFTNGSATATLNSTAQGTFANGGTLYTTAGSNIAGLTAGSTYTISGATLTLSNTYTGTTTTINVLAKTYASQSWGSGQATFSGTGAVTAFAIPHNMGFAPNSAIVTPASAAARLAFSVGVDATNITVTFASAPATGTNNVVINWKAE